MNEKLTRTVTKHRGALFHIFLICLIAYATGAIWVLANAIRQVQHIEGAFFRPQSLIAFSIISFILVLLISAYNLGALIRRRKRRSDHQRLSRAKLIRAKHRRSWRAAH
ncbi:MAG: hypothetical protein LBC88_04620 [Spirochaetaceae bacterium]|jgi:uncharacterized membrane protein|nr:hypothetical protein [Spirochaetaceae bacterium]